MNILELIVNEKTKVSELDLKPSNLNIKYQGKPVDNKPTNLLAPNKPDADTQQGKMNISYPKMDISPKAPSAQPAAAAPSAETEPEQSKFSKGWEKFKQGAKQAASATAQGVKKYGPGVARGAANLATGAVQAAGNIAAQTAAGLGQTATAGIGGAIKGYKDARAGKQFKLRPDAADEPVATSAPSAPSSAAPAAAAGNVDNELASLKSLINRLDRRLDNLEKPAAQTKVAEQKPNLRIAR